MFPHETGLIESQQQNFYIIEKQLKRKKYSLTELSEFIPGYFHINHKENLDIVFANQDCIEFIGLPFEELVQKGSDFLLETCPQSSISVLFPTILKMNNPENSRKVLGYMHKFRQNKNKEFQNLIGFTKFLKDLECFVTVDNPVSVFGKMAAKLSKLLDDDNYIRMNYKKFALLTQRECQILKLIGLGKSRNQIADSLFISKHTFDNHRKHIREKLGIHNISELFRFISAFEIV